MVIKDMIALQKSPPSLPNLELLASACGCALLPDVAPASVLAGRLPEQLHGAIVAVGQGDVIVLGDFA